MVAAKMLTLKFKYNSRNSNTGGHPVITIKLANISHFSILPKEMEDGTMGYKRNVI